MNATGHIVRECVAQSTCRFDLWTRFLNLSLAKRVAEVGVYKGDFASKVLRECDAIEKYYMLDPWRHLDDWNKPANNSNSVFDQFLREAKEKTDFAIEKRIILRGKTTEVVAGIPNHELDFAYIDGDHTLKGITVDLIQIFPKIKVGGWIAGDDFSRTVWQHPTTFEPTLVFPFAVYFAEAVGCRVYGLPYDQFLIEKSSDQEFEFIDLTDRYDDTSLRDQFHPTNVLKLKIQESIPLAKRVGGRMKRLLFK